MSTLHPDAINECYSGQAEVNITDDNLHITANTTASSKVSPATGKRNRPTSPRNPSRKMPPPPNEDDDQLFRFESKKGKSFEAMKKRRKTTIVPNMTESTVDTPDLPEEPSEIPSHGLLLDHSKDPVNVIFAEDSESISLDNDSAQNKTPIARRDHRSNVRSIFDLCFNSPGTQNLGAVLAFDSEDDDEM